MTYGGQTPIRIAFGHDPPEIVDLESKTPPQICTAPTQSDVNDELVRRLSRDAHNENRQADDIRRDLAERLHSSGVGPLNPGEAVWYWDRDQSKIRGGEWIRSRVIAVGKPPMVMIELSGQAVQVNQSKLRKNPDPWHDVVIPGLEGRDGVVTVPGVDPSGSP